MTISVRCYASIIISQIEISYYLTQRKIITPFLVTNFNNDKYGCTSMWYHSIHIWENNFSGTGLVYNQTPNQLLVLKLTIFPPMYELVYCFRCLTTSHFQIKLHYFPLVITFSSPIFNKRWDLIKYHPPQVHVKLLSFDTVASPSLLLEIFDLHITHFKKILYFLMKHILFSHMFTYLLIQVYVLWTYCSIAHAFPEHNNSILIE